MSFFPAGSMDSLPPLSFLQSSTAATDDSAEIRVSTDDSLPSRNAIRAASRFASNASAVEREDRTPRAMVPERTNCKPRHLEPLPTSPSMSPLARHNDAPKERASHPGYCSEGPPESPLCLPGTDKTKKSGRFQSSSSAGGSSSNSAQRAAPQPVGQIEDLSWKEVNHAPGVGSIE